MNKQLTINRIVMKKIFILIALAVIPATMGAQKTSRNKTQNKPINVIEQLNNIIYNFAIENGESYEKIKNPNTNTIESFERIVKFSLPIADSDFLKVAGQAFQKDEELSYRLSHMVPNSGDLVNLKVITDNGNKRKSLRVRANSLQEMWLMCCKNAENPQFRDAYSIVWEKRKDKIYGTIYIITSLRPDLFENTMETARSTFKIEGRVDENIKDSLYNIYIADTYEELNNVADDDYVACVPVINKRFSYSVELDKPKVGRLRCIFPDGSLCSAWIDLDFVPNETYKITVHNGYFDGDNDYEQRVGRFSGKSLITNLGVVAEPDSCAPVASSASEQIHFSALDAANKWKNNLDYVKKATFESEQQKITHKAEIIKENYTRIQQLMNIINGTKSRKTSWKNVDDTFKSIKEWNALLDKDIEGLISTMNSWQCPPEALLILHSTVVKEILNPQTIIFNELCANYGSLSKAAQNCQKYINSLSEKHIKCGETYILHHLGIE